MNGPHPAPLEIRGLPCLADNYAWLLRDPATGTTAVVDAPDPGPILAALEAAGWPLHEILNTHHHHDHAGGNTALRARTGCRVRAAAADHGRIAPIDLPVQPGDGFHFGAHTVRVIGTPGHTRAHLCWWFVDDGAVFTGDTLFSLGCGRLFEGTPAQMWASLQQLMTLPDETRIYCAHEYTLANGRFALTLEPGNTDLITRMEDVMRLRAAGQGTLPTTLGAEKRCNPFLRPHSPALRRTLDMADASDVEVWTEIRRRKDTFRG